ncbi:uncharacterized protein [Typha latifolia]|uniref:uncharacterized protein n=1 Tax=Typha latifolia TaxID=4733 RepID=UPI003C2F3F77
MEKRHRSTLPSSVDDLLSAATSLFSSNSGKSTLKTQIWSLTPSSPLVSSLPSSLHLSISQSVSSSKSSSPTRSSRSPPSKRSRGTQSQNLDAIHLKNLRAYAYVAQLCLSHPKKPFPPSELLPAVRSLHDGLVLYEADPVLLSQVAALCEDWWKAQLPGREQLITQSLPFLLSKSLTICKKADVKRVYTLREAFMLFDYSDESIEDVRLLLVRCVITPVYLKTDEGRRFVAFLLGLNGQLAKEALALIRSQIPFGRKSVLEAYGEIIFKAWKGSVGCLREEIEDGFLQGLIEGAIHASSRSLAASIRRVLGGFIDQRATDGVEKLLFRLVEPVLFRSLQVANSNVRQNALYLFLDMFPLEDPDVTKEAKDTLLDKQFFLLDKLLLDDCPEVRTVAVEGLCRILHLFWEVIPSSMITKFLAKIIDNMSHDSCNEVRLSTVNGAIYLLDNPQTHEIMKVLIPRLGSLVLDPVLSVRVAIVDLLLVVRDIHSFQFHKIVGLDTLLSSLANDHSRVAQKITRLLIPSYFPSKLTLKEACSRVVALVKRSPAAGARFCEFALSEGSSLRSLMELLRVFTGLALSRKGLNPDQIDGLLVASANIIHGLSKESSSMTALREFFSTAKLKCLLTAAASERARTSILTIASAVSPDNLAGLRGDCMDIILNSFELSENVEQQGLILAVHKLMLSCGWFDDMFKALTKVLERSAKSVTSNSELEFATAAAAASWQIKYLLNTEDARNSILKSPVSRSTFSSLKTISQLCIEQCLHSEHLDIAPISAYMSFAVYMSLQDIDLAGTEKHGSNKNNDFQQGSSFPETEVDRSVDHLLNCAEKFFGKPVHEKPCNTSSKLKRRKKVVEQQRSRHKETLEGDELKNGIHEARETRNLIKLVTMILKFFVDAATMKLAHHHQVRCLKFASAYIQHVLSAIRRHQQHEESLEGENSKDMLTLLRSYFSYAAKLLHLVLTSSDESLPPPREAFYLANDLLDLLPSVESCLGSKHASYFVSIAKQWLPVLVLGLGCNQLCEATYKAGGPSKLGDFIGEDFPVWLAALGKAELVELNELSENEQATQITETKESVFRKLVQMIVILLKKGSPRILDAVSSVFFAGLEVALERADSGLVLGLVHFICVKVLSKDCAVLDELKLTSSSLHEFFLQIERYLSDHDVDDGHRQELESARTLVRSILV